LIHAEPDGDCDGPTLTDIIEKLPHLNASLNALATVLLIAGYVQIKRRQEVAHKWTMLACFAVSVVFLASYLTYHAVVGHKSFPTYPPIAIQYGYKAVLLTHVVLAAAVPFLAIATIWQGLADRRRPHRKLGWWTFPIWLYVSITGVIVYLMLYQIYPPR
jgi:putative membrane protein